MQLKADLHRSFRFEGIKLITILTYLIRENFRPLFFLTCLIFLASCTIFGDRDPEPEQKTPTPGHQSEITPTITVIPSPTPVPRILTVCTVSEPDDLYIYSGRTLAKSHVLEAIYDGPIDTRGFDFQPVILEKLPDLSDGDAWIQPVTVNKGDWVINNAGNLVQLTLGEVVRPFGCNQSDCAISWEGEPLEMAQLSAEFILREDVKWSDGQPLTSKDSVFSFDVARSCQTEDGRGCGGNGLVLPDQRTVENTETYTALNDKVVRWVGVPGFIDPDYQVNFFIPLPQHVLGDLPSEQLFSAHESTRTPLGWGAYQIDDWEPGEFIRLRANPNYFRAGEGLPRFTMLIIRFLESNLDSNLEALVSGECDLLDQEASQLLFGAYSDRILEFHQQGEIAANITTGTVWEQIAFGIQPRSYDGGYRLGVDRPAFFSDPRTRQAIALCLDRQRVVDEILSGFSLVPTSYIPPTHPLFNPDITGYDYDPQAGMALLEEVGWVDHDGDPATPRVARGVHNILDGTMLSLDFYTSAAVQRQQASMILAESLAACGIQVELKVLPANEVYAEGPDGPVFGRQFDLAQLAWLTGHRPPCNLFISDEVMGPPGESWTPLNQDEEIDFLYGWGGQNLTGFSNPEFDSACYAALMVLPGQEGYLDAQYKAQEIFASQLPVVPLYLHLKIALTHPDLTGFTLDASVTSELWNIEEFDRVE